MRNSIKNKLLYTKHIFYYLCTLDYLFLEGSKSLHPFKKSSTFFLCTSPWSLRGFFHKLWSKSRMPPIIACNKHVILIYHVKQYNLWHTYEQRKSYLCKVPREQMLVFYYMSKSWVHSKIYPEIW